MQKFDNTSHMIEDVLGRQGSIRIVRWFTSRPLVLYITYLDESGTTKEARHFVVAGICVFERQTYFLAQELDRLQSAYFPEESGQVHFHASDLRAKDDHVKPPYDKLALTNVAS